MTKSSFIECTQSKDQTLQFTCLKTTAQLKLYKHNAQLKPCNPSRSGCEQILSKVGELPAKLLNQVVYSNGQPDALNVTIDATRYVNCVHWLLSDARSEHSRFDLKEMKSASMRKHIEHCEISSKATSPNLVEFHANIITKHNIRRPTGMSSTQHK